MYEGFRTFSHWVGREGFSKEVILQLKSKEKKNPAITRCREGVGECAGIERSMFEAR